VTAWSCELALLPDGRVARDLRVEESGGRITAVVEDSDAGDGERLPGLVVPGLANSHSHAFHRALRGRTQRAGGPGGPGSFWTWREQMYAVAGRLDPDSYRRLATAVFAEMAMAGVTGVGEFHYLHHGPDGRPYAEPNATGLALVEAARAAGLRIALLDTLYLTGGVGGPLEGVQRRFGDGDADRWAQRVEQLRGALGPASDVVVGVAAHSVRGVPADQLPGVAAAAQGGPLHVHVSEQPAENEQCLATYGVTPTRLLHDAGLLGPMTTAVHATHLTDDDVRLLGSSRTYACFCPTTERDLADGIGPAGALRDAGSPLTLGSDSHAVVDLLEEARAVEMHQRLSSGVRGSWSAADLLAAATAAGHESLGFPDAGRIEVGARADLVAVRLDSVRTAGGTAADALERVVFAATAADVTDVVASGQRVVAGGRHVLGDVGRLLTDAIDAVAP
jgi:formiminoglutamate deiminase